MANTIGQINAEIGAKLDKFDKAMRQVDSKLDKMSKSINDKGVKSSDKLNAAFGKLGTTIAAAFSVRAIAKFSQEAFKLAGQMEGVQRGFDRLGGTPELMEELTKATRGTVSQLQLMQSAVKAGNFKLSLEALPQLFEFSSRRAQETGESVDYLVESIVTGIGRKSPLILDNLGISASQLKDELNGASLEASSMGEITEAVGRIATAELAKMGPPITTAADETAKLSASWENFMTEVGKSDAVVSLIQKMTEVTNDFTNAVKYGFEVTKGDVEGLKSDIEAFAATTEERAKQAIESGRTEGEVYELMKRNLARFNSELQNSTGSQRLNNEMRVQGQRMAIAAFEEEHRLQLTTLGLIKETTDATTDGISEYQRLLDLANETADTNEKAAVKWLQHLEEVNAALEIQAENISRRNAQVARGAAEAQQFFGGEEPAMQSIQEVPETFEPVPLTASVEQTERFLELYRDLPARIEAVGAAFGLSEEQAKTFAEQMNVTANEFTFAMNAALGFGAAIQSALIDSMNQDQDFASGLIDFFENLIKKLIAAAIAAAVLVGVLSAIGIGAGGGGFMAIFSNLAGIGGGAGGNFLSGALADGGTVGVGGTYLVGEQGPELFTPSTTGRIIPNGATQAVMGGMASSGVSSGNMMSGGQTVHVVGTISGNDIRITNQKSQQRNSRSLGG